MRYRTANNLRDVLVGAWSPAVTGRQTGATGFILPDLSGRGNHGTLTLMDPATDWVTAQGYSSLDFDGLNDYTTHTQPAIQLPLTLSGWARCASTAGARTVISIGQETNEFVLLEVNGNWWALSQTASNVQAIGTSTISTGVLYHAAAVFESATSRKIYVNGVLEATDTTSNAPVLTAPNVRLGNRTHSGGVGQLWSGQIAEALLDSRALTHAEVIERYRLGPGGWATPRRRRVYAPTAAAPAGNRRRRVLIGAA